MSTFSIQFQMNTQNSFFTDMHVNFIDYDVIRRKFSEKIQNALRIKPIQQIDELIKKKYIYRIYS